MLPTYTGHGLSFLYPEGWTLEESAADGGWSVLVQSPGTAFLQLVGQPRAAGDSAEQVCRDLLDSALTTLREDYPELETEPATEPLLGHTAQGEDVSFISLDLTASCFLRALALPKQFLLILCQTSDLELAAMEPVLRAMRASLKKA